MCHHLKPPTVESYLSGIQSKLELYFPNIRANHRHNLVKRTLAGGYKLFNSPVNCKRALTREDLGQLTADYTNSSNHDDLLFAAIIVTGFHGLMRLGKFVWPDNMSLQDYDKVILRCHTEISNSHYSFTILGHKADRQFEGNIVRIDKTDNTNDPLHPFSRYTRFRDAKFAHSPELFLRANGSIPMCSWFIAQLQVHFPDGDVAGHSLRSGGATMIAELRLPPHIIQLKHCWSSNTF